MKAGFRSKDVYYGWGGRSIQSRHFTLVSPTSQLATAINITNKLKSVEQGLLIFLIQSSRRPENNFTVIVSCPLTAVVRYLYLSLAKAAIA